MHPFSWFTVESVLCFEFNPHIDGRTILAALWEHWLYKDLGRESVYCLVAARMCNLHYARGLQLCGLKSQPWLMSSWHEAEQPHSHSCSRELISAATPGSQGKQCKYNSLSMTAPEGATLNNHGSIFLCVCSGTPATK